MEKVVEKLYKELKKTNEYNSFLYSELFFDETFYDKNKYVMKSNNKYKAGLYEKLDSIISYDTIFELFKDNELIKKLREKVICKCTDDYNEFVSSTKYKCFRSIFEHLCNEPPDHLVLEVKYINFKLRKRYELCDDPHHNFFHKDDH